MQSSVLLLYNIIDEKKQIILDPFFLNKGNYKVFFFFSLSLAFIYNSKAFQLIWFRFSQYGYLWLRLTRKSFNRMIIIAECIGTILTMVLSDHVMVKMLL